MAAGTGDRRPLTAFDRYADWYDAFNEAKNYDAEVRYLLRIVAEVTSPPRRWLDIGSGTGHHAAALAARGIDVDGVELSPAMVARARRAYPHIRFHLGSAQDFALEGDRDVISMLFHVVNYQTSDAMLRTAFARVAAHLAPSGLLLLDFWNSDAVLNDPPVRRVREAGVDGRPLFRISTPREDRDRRRIDVLYEFRWDSPDGSLVHEELHTLRHFTSGELAEFLGQAGLTVMRCDAWMQDRPLAADDWYGVICARRDPDGPAMDPS
jgi:SAM-dependent methyltransferase